jgi:DNA-binding transcriptional ArsR family regulator
MPRPGSPVRAGEDDHPVRAAILEALDWIGEPCSPVQLAPCLDEKPAIVNYHVLALLDVGALEVATHQRRGVQERRYRLAES